MSPYIAPVENTVILLDTRVYLYSRLTFRMFLVRIKNVGKSITVNERLEWATTYSPHEG